MGKNSKEDKGCIGYGVGGIMKQTHIKVFQADSVEDMNSLLDEHRKYYGNEYTLKYVTTDNPSKYYKKFDEKINEKATTTISEGIYNMPQTTACTILREFSDKTKKSISSLGKPKKEKKVKKDSKKKSKNDESSESESEDDKKKNNKSKTKKENKKGKTEKDESSDESESENSDSD